MELDSALPERGRPADQLWSELDQLQAGDVNWRAGRVQGYVYWAGEDLLDVSKEAYRRFFSSSPLNPKLFPSTRALEESIVAMSSRLLSGSASCGVVTSGGTESNFLAVLAAREQARTERPSISYPEIVIPATGHPSFNKAAHLLGLRVVRVPVTSSFAADPDGMRRAVTSNTVLLVASAPSYTHGVLDPVGEVAAIGAASGIPVHVDACVGGFVLPFLAQLGTSVPDWDFRLPGVTTISADLHKHGYTARGTSVLLHGTAGRDRLHSFEFADWPNGRYFTRVFGGSRPGGVLASAWAVMNHLGAEGYRRVVAESMRLTQRLQAGIVAIADLEILGRPIMNKFGYRSRALDITAVADGLEAAGWAVGRQARPPAINAHVLPVHKDSIDQYLADLASAVDDVVSGRRTTAGKEAAYN